jgi:sulfur-oxidizing protein SoxY
MLRHTGRHSRRAFLAGTGLAAAAAIIGARSSAAAPADAEAALRKLLGGRPAEPGRLKLDIPAIAENGQAVPVNVEADSPMTADNYVRAIHLFAEGNPWPEVYTYRFTPESGRAAVSNRIRLAQTETVIAVAEMSDGTFHIARQEVKVTVGGCGG